jgi:hypothetical protein
MDVLCASYEGVNLLSRNSAGTWSRRQLGVGNQDNPKSNRGASEIKLGTLKNGKKYIATIEPWHGNQVVVYTEPAEAGDLDGDGDEELIIGVRDDLSQQAGQRRGVRIYKATDGKGAKWTRQIIEDGGVAVEDAAAADLNGDGRIDIVAVGRATGNCRIYWNEGK